MAGKISESDLVVLMYASPNNCYVHAVSVPTALASEPTLRLDLEKRVWSFMAWNNVPFGKSRSPYLNGHEHAHGIVGVYNRTDIRHLNTMVQDAIEAIRARGPVVDVD